MDFSIFFFADSGSFGPDRYGLLLESARFADSNGFVAVWTPERHFHSFGGQYPNPAVTGAALAAVTERLAIRAGSVVAPLHHPLRIAEEWSVVDNLSKGRAGVSFASGWHAADFVLRPENYHDRRQTMVQTIETVKRLWRGDSVEFVDGSGDPRAVRIFPSPVQPELPIWITTAGSPDTFRTAGRLGAGVLTHLVGQELDALKHNISQYRDELAAAHGDRVPGHVALMLHTLLGPDRDEIREIVREPLGDYLRSSIDLIARTSIPGGIDPARLTARDLDFLIARSFDRFFSSSGLFGTLEDGAHMVQRLSAIGVNEIACLIDFGVPFDEVMKSLHHVGDLLRQPVSAS